MKGPNRTVYPPEIALLEDLVDDTEEGIPFKRKGFEELPDDSNSYMNSYEKEWASAIGLYNFPESHSHDTIKAFDKKWIKESLLGVHISNFFKTSGEGHAG
ncbi:hypothetical protein EDC94DRAFT_694735 [Helicostylum pulchrum]|nr:hypothetical protein EDC94DRAFT_694735 [Helicostylum pulchrum]